MTDAVARYPLVQAACLPAQLLPFSQVPENDWTEQLGERDLFLHPRWLEVGHGTYGGGLIGSTAAIHRERSSSLAVTAAWAYTQTCTEFLCRPDLIMGLEGEQASQLFPAVIAGGWYDSRIASSSAEPLQQSVSAIVDALEGWARSLDARSICWPSVDDREVGLRHTLGQRGYLSKVLSPRWALEVTWPDLTSYFQSLGPSRRVSARREWAKVRAAGVAIEARRLTADLAPLIVRLAMENAARYDTAIDAVAYVQWIQQLAGAEAIQAFVHLAVKDGDVLGCVVTSTRQGRLYALFPGFAYDKLEGLPLYFALAFYHLVDFATKFGLHAIEYGPTADGAKAGRGCHAYTQSIWWKPLQVIQR